ncbi:MAG TPA: holo-ACP synthase [Desulfohalobiaceae bacterium]|nr:holo-ACP synthase [Desulfohalobiaceae bacterium]
MIIGIGHDIVEIDRIAKIWQRFGHKFSSKILTTEEQKHIPGKAASYLASRFAAKEAAVKALGTGFSLGITFQSLSVFSEASGQPKLLFRDRALARLLELCVTQHHISITHSINISSAVVILEKRED